MVSSFTCTYSKRESLNCRFLRGKMRRRMLFRQKKRKFLNLLMKTRFLIFPRQITSSS